MISSGWEGVSAKVEVGLVDMLSGRDFDSGPGDGYSSKSGYKPERQLRRK